MKYLMMFSRAIDALNGGLGKVLMWLILLTVLISAANAISHYAFSISSNAWLEIQWYLFAWMVMVGAPYVLKANEHVRVDLIYGKLKGQGAVYVDIFGLVDFLMPVMGFLTWISFPYFWNTFVTGEQSSNAGGLIRWPVTLAMPTGFALVWLQSLAELIKRVAYLRGEYAMDTHYEKPLQ